MLIANRKGTWLRRRATALFSKVGSTFAAAIAAALILTGAGPAEARSYPTLFRSKEIRGDSLQPFPKWRGTLERYFKDKRVPENCRDGSKFNVCHLKTWDEFLKGMKGQNVMNQLRAVNQEMNRRRYILDPINWGVEDYWASPLQFFKRQGDCEDYAIAKFMSLRALGVPNEDMRIVVLMDTNLQLAHAVLVVYVGGKAYILDNQISRVVSATKIRHYKPIYSINETSWWLHRAKA